MRNPDPHANERNRLVKLLSAHASMMAQNVSLQTRVFGTIEKCDCDMCKYALRRLSRLAPKPKGPTRNTNGGPLIA